MEKKKLAVGLILSGLLLALVPSVGQAAGVSFSGNLENGITVSSPDVLVPQTCFNNQLNLKMEINAAEKQTGTVLLQYKYTVPSDITQLIINQAYLDWQLSPNSFLRTGRQKISWGTGFAWNPTNYIGADKNRADLTTEFPGVDALNYEVSWGESAATLLIKPDSDSNSRLNNWGYAFKYGFRVLHSDISLTCFHQEDAGAFGADLAAAVGSWTVYTELAAKTGRMVYIDPDLNKTNRPGDQYYIHGIVGVQGLFSNNWMAQLEYYYNQEGWTGQEAAVHQSYLMDYPLASDMANYFADLRQHYLFIMVRKGNLVEDVSFTCCGFWNMDDQSYILSPAIDYQLGQNARVTLMVNCYGGDSSSEFGSRFNYQVSGKMTLSF